MEVGARNEGLLFLFRVGETYREMVLDLFDSRVTVFLERDTTLVEVKFSIGLLSR